jgi:hypothetical protein
LAENTEVDHIKLMAITWNMAGGTPSDETLDLIFQKDNV